MLRKDIVMDEINFLPIGVVRSPYEKHEGAPIQAIYGIDTGIRIIINEEYREGLTDIEGFDYIWVISCLDKSKDYKLKVIPYRDTVERGLFATRSPSRPNPIGISAVKLISVDKTEGILEIEGIDLLNDTPVLDIKPYIKSVDSFDEASEGWFGKGNNSEIADDRFSRE